MTTPSSQVPRPGAVVAAAADGEQQAVVAGEADGRRDVVGVGAARDQRRALVDHRVVDRARLVVVGVVGPDQPALGTRRAPGARPARVWSIVLMRPPWLVVDPGRR